MEELSTPEELQNLSIVMEQEEDFFDKEEFYLRVADFANKLGEGPITGHQQQSSRPGGKLS